MNKVLVNSCIRGQLPKLDYIPCLKLIFSIFKLGETGLLLVKERKISQYIYLKLVQFFLKSFHKFLNLVK